MSLTNSKKKLLSRITKIPEHEIGWWYNIASLAIYKSPVHDHNDQRNVILIMTRLYNSSIKRRSSA